MLRVLMVLTDCAGQRWRVVMAGRSWFRLEELDGRDALGNMRWRTADGSKGLAVDLVGKWARERDLAAKRRRRAAGGAS